MRSPGAAQLVAFLAETTDDPVWVIDPFRSRFLAVNASALTLLGFSKGELSALPPSRIFPSLAEKTVRWQGEGRILLDGNDSPLTKSGHPVSSPVECIHLTDEHHGHVLVLRVRRCEEVARLRMREQVVETTLEFPAIIGQSEQVRDVCRYIGLVAKTDTTVLVQGESGTGKELVGQAIHFHSHRAQGPLIKVNCTALTETLLESELFGHKKGAFTGAIQDRKGRFALANGGTIILDEIGSMPVSGQAKLLRVLQEKEFEPVGDSTTVSVNVRVIGITNLDLLKAIHEGKFREDLYYRLSAFPIRLPPLRERKVDMDLLARHFLRKHTAAIKKTIDDIEPETLSQLVDYNWPGNVRELENTIEYAVILEKSRTLTPASLPDKLRSGPCADCSLNGRLRLAEKEIILEALTKAKGIKSRAARLLGIDRRNFAYFIQKHRLDNRPEYGYAANAASGS